MEKAGMQESQYEFPYHYLPQVVGGAFSQARVLSWGYEYQSYIDYIVSVLKSLPARKSLIDIGCGDGRLIYELHRALPTLSISGSDFSSRALALAHAFTPSAELSTDLPGGTFDAFTLIEVLEHIPPDEISDFLKSVSAIVSSGGIGIVTVPSDTTPVQRKHYQHFSEETLRDALAPYFTVTEVRHLNSLHPEVRLMQRMLTNRFFAVTHAGLLSWWYRRYTTRHLQARPQTGKRLLAVVRKA